MRAAKCKQRGEHPINLPKYFDKSYWKPTNGSINTSTCKSLHKILCGELSKLIQMQIK